MSSGIGPVVGSAAVVGDGGVGEQVGHAPEAGLLADRQLEGGHAGAEGCLQLLEGPFERGPLPVELVDEDQPGQAQVGRGLPHVRGLHLDAFDRADHEDGQVGDAQGGGGLLGEVGVAGAVEQVDLVALPLDGRQRSRDRQAPLVLLGLEVGDGGGVLDPAGAPDGPGAVQQGLGQGGLAGSAVPDEGHVADRRRWVGLHLRSSPGNGPPSPDPGSSRDPPYACPASNRQRNGRRWYA